MKHLLTLMLAFTMCYCSFGAWGIFKTNDTTRFPTIYIFWDAPDLSIAERNFVLNARVVYIASKLNERNPRDPRISILSDLGMQYDKPISISKAHDFVVECIERANKSTYQEGIQTSRPIKEIFPIVTKINDIPDVGDELSRCLSNPNYLPYAGYFNWQLQKR